MRLSLYKSDMIGTSASLLCIIHCLITPFIIAFHANVATSLQSTPIWWEHLDYLLLLISMLSVYTSAQYSECTFMKPALWTNWVLLCTLILNEKLELFHSIELITYIVAFSLSGLHIYNIKHHQCKNESCCNHGNNLKTD